MGAKVYHDATKALDLSGTVLKNSITVGGDDRECPECKGWVRVSNTNYLGNRQVMEAITHARPCEAYRQWLREQGVGDDYMWIRN